jgi:hypothetical protein
LISAPDYNRDYLLYISALAVSVAGVLVQIGDDARDHVIYYISKNLLGTPLKYNHEEKIALTVVLAVQKLHHYILLRTTKVIADSNPMQYLLRRRQINGKFSRWIVIVQEYDLEFSTPKRKKDLILAEHIMAFPSDITSPPVNTNLPDEHLFFLSPQMTLGMAIFLSIYEHKNLETTSLEMIVDVFFTRHLATSSSGTSYIGEELTTYSVDA